jgi:hypothetical protein
MTGARDYSLNMENNKEAGMLNLTKGNVEFIAEMRNNGLTRSAIGREFGVTGETIKRAYIRGSRKYF